MRNVHRNSEFPEIPRPIPISGLWGSPFLRVLGGLKLNVRLEELFFKTCVQTESFSKDCEHWQIDSG